MPVTREQFIAEAKKRGLDTSKFEQDQPQAQGGGVKELLGGIFNRLPGAVATATGTKMQDNTGSDLEKLYAEQAIKKQFEDPTVRQLREAEIAALSQPTPEGTIRVGRQIINDPTYVKPADQAKIDEANRANEMATQNIRSRAEQNLGSIAEAKKGSRFFGPLGNVPTIADPQSALGLNTKHYAERKTWENNINQLLSQKVVDLITEMKSASKTGATGFGSLTEKEGAVLREASTALSKDLPGEQAMYYLNEMEKINKRILGLPTEDSNSSSPGLSDDDAYNEYLKMVGQ